MFRAKGLWIAVIVLVLVGGGGYAAYASGVVPWWTQDAAEEEGPALQTATVSVGDLSITADGSGVLVASSEVELAFDGSGTLMELLVEVGDSVQAGDVLGWIDDTEARNAVADAELAVLQAEDALEEAQDLAGLEQAAAEAELAVARAEADLLTAQGDLADLLDWAPDEHEVEVAQANLTIAEATYQNTVSKAEMWDQQLASTRINLEQAIRDLEEAQVNYANAMDAARDWEKNIEDTRQRAAEALQNAQDSLEIAQANYELALIDTRQIEAQNDWVKVLDARETLDALHTPPDEAEIAAARIAVQELEVTLGRARLDLADAQEALTEADTREAELALQQAQLKLASAQASLAGTTLVAPISGTVIEVAAQVGEQVGSGAVVVLADLAAPMVQFWVEESDLNSVAVGHRVNVAFEALPDLTFPGEILRVDPVLVDVNGTTAVQAWANFDTSAQPVQLLGDMNVEVEIVAGEALNALLVSMQALRELGEGQYAVFVVEADGTLELRPVEVGLKDYVNAQIVSGLQRGEVVSTGQTTSTSSGQSTTDSPAPPAGGGMMGFLGG
jgi:RND family efflux transporter MFP subunit